MNMSEVLRMSSARMESILADVRAVKWMRVGDWEAPVLYENIYCLGLKDYVSDYAQIKHNRMEFLHVKPITYISPENYEKFAAEVRKKIENAPSYLDFLTDSFKERAAVHKAIGARISHTSLSLESLSNNNLQEMFEEYVESLLRMTPYSYVFSWGEEYIFGRLMREIVMKGTRAKKPGFREYFLRLTAPPSGKDLAMIESQDALFDLVRIAQKDKNLRYMLEAGQMPTQTGLKKKNRHLYFKILQFTEKYGWLGTRHFLGEPTQVKDVIRQIWQLKELDIESERTRRRQAGELRERQFAEAVAELGIEGNDLEIVNGICEHVYLKSYRKELMSKVAFEMRPLFWEISDRMGLGYDEFVNLTLDEVREFFEKGEVLSLETLKEREQGYAYAVIGSEIMLVVGDMLQRVKASLYTQYKDEVTGQPANVGIVTGIVRVVLKKEDVDKLRTGDVFVTDMTNADIAVAACRCSAIVTDKGGILCHAAILSRELGIPCIVGTGNATQILKDGQWVEVDATKGVVRLLGLDQD
jgi:phosphohistidine swiveling domain-containing protein